MATWDISRTSGTCPGWWTPNLAAINGKNTFVICLHYFSSNEMLEAHSVDCNKMNKCTIVLPDEDNKWLNFTSYNRKERMPFVVYADLECILQKTNDDPKLYQRHQACSIGMLRNRKRTTSRGTTDMTNYKIAAEEHFNCKISIRAAAKEYGLCHVTLTRFIKKLKSGDTSARVGYHSVKRIFSDEEENILQNYIITCSSLCYGLSPKDVRRLAYQLAVKHNKQFSTAWHDKQLAARPTLEEKCLLLLDNHESHLLIKALDFCKNNGIVLLSFPPHCTHKLQPLDRAVYGPFKKMINTASDKWMRNNPGKTMTIHHIPGIVREAFPLAVTDANAIAGFKCTGISPFNRNIFTPVDFAPAAVTDRPPIASVQDDSNNNQNLAIEKENVLHNNQTESQVTDPKPGPSGLQKQDNFSPEDIRPFPRAGLRLQTNRGRKRRKTAILTDTPEKMATEEEFNNRKKVKRNILVSEEEKTKSKKSKSEEKDKSKKKGKKRDNQK
ncbi:uncharacterized protein LOC113562203 [Ooceraea biroi]|nr:uncharacterized protein LOC113562203 [Ooceraea biroi]